MKSLSYEMSLSEETYGFLFKDVIENKVSLSTLDYSLEIITSALNGAIDFNKPFSIEKFASVSRKNDRLERVSTFKKITYFEEEGGLEIIDEKDDFSELVDEDELKYAIAKLKGIQYIKSLDRYVDIVSAIKSASRGILPAIQSIKEVCEADEEVAELVELVLASGRSIEECFKEV